MAESGMIIIAYFLLLLPGKYTASKSYINIFRLKDTAFSCGCSFFMATDTEGDLQSENFVTLTLTTQKNDAGKNRTQGIRGTTVVPQGGPPPMDDPPKSPRGTPLHPISPRYDSGGYVEKHNSHHDI